MMAFKMYDLEDFLPFVSKSIGLADDDFVTRAYSAFVNVNSPTKTPQIEGYCARQRFREFVGGHEKGGRGRTQAEAEEEEEQSAHDLNRLFLANVMYVKYAFDIQSIQAQNIFTNYYFDAASNPIVKQLFVAVVQLLFVVALLLDIIDTAEKDFRTQFENNLNVSFAVVICYLVCYLILPSIQSIVADMKLVSRYFHANPTNFLLNISSNIFIALFVPFITFLVILSSESMIDIVLNSTAIIFVIDLDDESTKEIDLELWFATKLNTFVHAFKTEIQFNHPIVYSASKETPLDIEDEQIATAFTNVCALLKDSNTVDHGYRDKVRSFVTELVKLVFLPLVTVCYPLQILFYMIVPRMRCCCRGRRQSEAAANTTSVAHIVDGNYRQLKNDENYEENGNNNTKQIQFEMELESKYDDEEQQPNELETDININTDLNTNRASTIVRRRGIGLIRTGHRLQDQGQFRESIVSYDKYISTDLRSSVQIMKTYSKSSTAFARAMLTFAVKGGGERRYADTDPLYMAHASKAIVYERLIGKSKVTEVITNQNGLYVENVAAAKRVYSEGIAPFRPHLSNAEQLRVALAEKKLSSKTEKEEKSEAFYMDAVKHLRAGEFGTKAEGAEYQLCIDAISNAIVINPTCARFHFVLSDAYNALAHKYKIAKDEAMFAKYERLGFDEGKKAFDIDNLYALAMFGLVGNDENRATTADLELALIEYTTQIDYDSTQFYFYYLRGRVHLALHRLAEARTDFNFALEKDPTNIIFLLYRGYTKEKAEERIECWKDALNNETPAPIGKVKIMQALIPLLQSWSSDFQEMSSVGWQQYLALLSEKDRTLVENDSFVHNFWQTWKTGDPPLSARVFFDRMHYVSYESYIRTLLFNMRIDKYQTSSTKTQEACHQRSCELSKIKRAEYELESVYSSLLGATIKLEATINTISRFRSRYPGLSLVQILEKLREIAPDCTDWNAYYDTTIPDEEGDLPN